MITVKFLFVLLAYYLTKACDLEYCRLTNWGSFCFAIDVGRICQQLELECPLDSDSWKTV